MQGDPHPQGTGDAGDYEGGTEQYGFDRFEAVEGLLHRVQGQAGDQNVLVVALDGRDAIAPQCGEADAVPASVDGNSRKGAAITGGEVEGLVGGFIDDGRLGDGAVQEAGTEGRLGLTARVGTVVRVGFGLVFQAGGEPAAGGGELFVQPPHQEASQSDGGGEADGEAGETEQSDESGGELTAQGAGRQAPHGESGLRT